MDIEKLAREAGAEAWDVWRDDAGRLHISVDGIALTEEVVKLAALVVEECAKVCDALDEDVTDAGYGHGIHDAACAIRAQVPPQSEVSAK